MTDEYELFSLAFGINKPWILTNVSLSIESRKLDLYLDFLPGSLFSCPVCCELSPVYDTCEKTWRHMDIFQYSCYIHCRVPRISCEKCNVHLVEVPWARENSTFTLLMEAFILTLAKASQISQIANLIGEHDGKVWRVVKHYVDEARKSVSFDSVVAVGVDETSFKKGHNYISVFADLTNSTVLYVVPKRDASVVSLFKEDFLEHNGNEENISQFSCDLSPAFIKGIHDAFPECPITYDKFHVMKLMNEGLNEVRKEDQKNCPDLKNSKYLWLKNQSELSSNQNKKLMSLRELNLRTAQAYNIKLGLQRFWECKSKEEGEILLKEWYDWAINSELQPIINVAKTIKRHWDGILNFLESRISNGVLEAINTSIQNLKRNAKGYRNISNFITMIYLRQGNLQLNLPSLTHTK